MANGPFSSYVRRYAPPDPLVRRPHAAGISFDAPDLCKLYNFPTGITGADPIIAIIELGGGYQPSDIKAAFAKWGQPAPVLTDVSVDGGRNSPGDDADIEVLLDIQIAASAYTYCTGRAAHIRVYFAPNSGTGFADAVAQAARDGCTVTSISWGGPEDSWGSAACQAFDSVCATSVASGCTVLAASGDNNSGDGESGQHVDFPASSPRVVGCGGTNKPRTGTETVWNDGQNGTGGGFSAPGFFPVQSWQVGAQTGNGRMVPDLAADADPQTGYNVFANGSWTVVGGTSAVAPLVSGLLAAISCAAGRKLGNILTTIWSHPAAFVDITVGNNGVWRAKSGPDPCTGLGVPDGKGLLAVFLGNTVPPPSTVVVPGLIGGTWQSCNTALAAVGLIIAPASVPDPTVKVIGQSPAQGTAVIAGSTVTVTTATVTPPPPTGNQVLDLKGAILSPDHRITGGTWTLTPAKTSSDVEIAVAAFKGAKPDFALPPIIEQYLLEAEAIVAPIVLKDLLSVFLDHMTWAAMIAEVEAALKAGGFPLVAA